MDVLGLHRSTPAELQGRLAAERRGAPFVVLRDDRGVQRIVELDGERLSLGRSLGSHLALPWDTEVSRLHAQFERVGSEWLIVDDGLSSNGTFVSGARVTGRRRLSDGDEIRVGRTTLLFRDPRAESTETTRLSDQREVAAHITDAQRRVLVVLCRPYKHHGADAIPATNPQIAAELHLTVAAVKTHLHALFRAFEIDGLAQQEKRRRLVVLAFASGAVSDRDL